LQALDDFLDFGHVTGIVVAREVTLQLSKPYQLYTVKARYNDFNGEGVFNRYNEFIAI
jgi:hypothetical protein